MLSHIFTPALSQLLIYYLAVATPCTALTLQNRNVSVPLTRIDVHHHFFPPGLTVTPGEPGSDWPLTEATKDWSANVSIAAMDSLGIQKAILSFPVELDTAAHEINLYTSSIVTANPDRFGFFAALPIGGNTSIDTVLEEVAYALDTLKADGIALVSAYGTGDDAMYLGNDKLAPLWQELHDRKAIVFIHGAQTIASNAPPGDGLLPVAIVEVPNETYKAASDLVVSGKKRQYSDAKIILAHSGGSTPFLAARVAVLSNYVGIADNLTTLTIDEILEDFKSFYFETALSGYDANLVALQTFVEPDHILFGTDFPAVSEEMAEWYTKNVDAYLAGSPAVLADVMSDNWFQLVAS